MRLVNASLYTTYLVLDAFRMTAPENQLGFLRGMATLLTWESFWNLCVQLRRQNICPHEADDPKVFWERVRDVRAGTWVDVDTLQLEV